MNENIINKKEIIVAGFDPPASCNMGWAIFSTKDNNMQGKMLDAGVYHLPDEESERLLKIRDFVIDLIDKYEINCMCFERSIGFGMAQIREKISENTGVIKLVGASYGIKFSAIHTSTMAKQFTGSGSANKKKSRIKQIARDIFYPGKSYKEIAVSDNGNECFEHLSDAIGFCSTYLLNLGIPIVGAGGIIEPKK